MSVRFEVKNLNFEVQSLNINILTKYQTKKSIFRWNKTDHILTVLAGNLYLPNIDLFISSIKFCFLLDSYFVRSTLFPNKIEQKN